MNNEAQLLAHRIPAICRITGLGRNSIYEAFASGELTRLKIGRCTLVLDSDLRSFLARRFDVARAEQAGK